MKELLGMTWDHPRGFNSIVAATEKFNEQSTTCRISWHKRSLKDFGDFPIEHLVEKFDLIMIDHPFVGEAQLKNLLQPIETILPADFIDEQSQANIGSTFESYSFGDSQWALPIDAATQVSAYNPKLISQSSLPTNWDNYIELMQTASFRTKVLWPLCETDVWCSFLTIAAQLGNDQNKSVFSSDGLNHDLAVEALALLRQLTEHVSKDCWKMNPINTLELMSNAGSQIAFSPLLFGYNNYSRPDGKAQLIEFLNAVSFKKESPVALLGGVGIAISVQSNHHQELANYLQFIMREEILSGSYFDAGGQPSSKSAWMSNEINTRTAGFFSNTIQSMENAFVRPRVPGFNIFQERAAKLINEGLTGKSSSEEQIIHSIDKVYNDCCLNK